MRAWDRRRREVQPASDEARWSVEGLDVRQALARLPVRQRSAVVLHHLVGLPVEQVAQELQIPVGTVKSRVSRARKSLQPLLLEDTHVDATA